MSMYYYKNKMWEKCYDYAREALDIESKPLDYLCEEFAWGPLPYDLVSISAYNLGYIKEAITYVQLAIDLDPKNERLINNLKHYNEIVV